MDLFQSKFKDLKIISNIVFPAATQPGYTSLGGLAQSSSLSKLLDGTYPSDINNGIMHSSDANKENIHNTIYKSIGYKNMAGIRLEVKGRLTKRYRADRSIYSLKWKGGLKNVDSSFRGLSSVLFRGNSKSNVTYSIAKSKRRIGAFAVKGWISGK